MISIFFRTAVALFIVLPWIGPAGAAPVERPNVIIIFADDLGWGDLSCQGHPTIATPNLDRMASEGQRWTDFYSAASVCTPSRAALMTGRLPIRSGMCAETPRVLVANSPTGLPHSEITLAEALKEVGYATMCIGKWHLGRPAEFLPKSQGFDEYFGLPYSNDMGRFKKIPRRGKDGEPDYRACRVPLIRGDEVIEPATDQRQLTKRYTEESLRFIKTHKDEPFFLYLAHTMPHVPLFRSEKFVDHSRRGRYGDVVEEIDDGVGQILDTLRQLKLDKKTLVVFTSDNGPWLVFKEHGGSAGPLRDGKGGTFEGGMREPAVFWWPNTLAPGIVRDMGSTLDLFPTCVKLCGAQLPDDRQIDGVDISPALLGTGKSPRETMFFYRAEKLYAVRHGAYKAHFFTRPSYGKDAMTEYEHDPPLLYDLGQDPGEKYNIAAKHPEVIAQIKRIAEQHLKGVVPVENQLEKGYRLKKRRAVKTVPVKKPIPDRE
ncbi:MAG: sulfatase [Pirellulales bacterium]|nr:sulfatase [Pirellulales bacterium]